MGGGAWAEAGGVQGLPLAAGAQDEEDGLHADAVGGARPATAEAVGVLVFGEEFLHALPHLIGDAPVVGDGTSVHGQDSVRPQLSNTKRSCTKKL